MSTGGVSDVNKLMFLQQQDGSLKNVGKWNGFLIRIGLERFVGSKVVRGEDALKAIKTLADSQIQKVFTKTGEIDTHELTQLNAALSNFKDAAAVNDTMSRILGLVNIKEKPLSPMATQAKKNEFVEYAGNLIEQNSGTPEERKAINDLWVQCKDIFGVENAKTIWKEVMDQFEVKKPE
jgi:hypothetical protein